MYLENNQASPLHRIDCTKIIYHSWKIIWRNMAAFEEHMLTSDLAPTEQLRTMVYEWIRQTYHVLVLVHKLPRLSCFQWNLSRLMLLRWWRGRGSCWSEKMLEDGHDEKHRNQNGRGHEAERDRVDGCSEALPRSFGVEFPWRRSARVGARVHVPGCWSFRDEPIHRQQVFFSFFLLMGLLLQKFMSWWNLGIPPMLMIINRNTPDYI